MKKRNLDDRLQSEVTRMSGYLGRKKGWIGIDRAREESYAVAIVNDFLDLVIDASGMKCEIGCKKWAKWIDEIDMTEVNGYCFVGPLIGDGTVEVRLGMPRLILAQSSLRDESLKSGFLRQFRIVRMNADGSLTATHIATDDRRGGWALRMRNLTANLLHDLGSTQTVQKKSRFSNVEL